MRHLLADLPNIYIIVCDDIFLKIYCDSLKLKRRLRGDKRYRPNACLRKSGGVKMPLPYNLWRLWDYLFLPVLIYYLYL